MVLCYSSLNGLRHLADVFSLDIGFKYVCLLTWPLTGHVDIQTCGFPRKERAEQETMGLHYSMITGQVTSCPSLP